MCIVHDEVRFDTPIGVMGLHLCKNGVHSLNFLFNSFDPDRCKEVAGEVHPQKKEEMLVADELTVLNWLRAYFEGRVDDLPKLFENMRFCCLASNGNGVSEFAVKVYNQLCAIPFGSTIHYSEVAAKIGQPKAARAVGGAVSVNPVTLIIPCHRVVPKTGSVGRYSHGKLDELKKTLLHFEARLLKKKVFIVT
ncbi:methylated dna protein cysteine; methylated dna (protein) cysteine [Trichuris trichiura]|uniref:Methylated-DNA--protein-cysteine methyltransferase n=1 Tax=Trichuris trichiura TaxID=36087 RepID=A0A077ZF19_TRITR|nr:methylated dna protein cysteine; methylated dna (protein) cysteine [Trichuris trichiura]